ncbi:MAG TPA: ATP-binding protein, partial [Trebonia sp.]
RVVGRLDAAEAGRPEYGFLPASQRVRATIAKPGAMFVSQPQIPVPLAVEFPFPAWATRLSECAEPIQMPAAPAGGMLSRLPADDDIPPF